MAGIQDNLGKPVPEYETIMNFNAAREDGGSTNANQYWKMCN